MRRGMMRPSLMVVSIALLLLLHQSGTARAFVRDQVPQIPRLHHASIRVSSTSSTSRRLSSTGTALKKSMWSEDSDLEGSDKLKACVPYFLPLLDGDHFGKFLFDRIPPVGLLHDIFLGGLVNLWDIFPFTGLVFFIALTLGTRQNTDMARNVRFSAQQAALINVSLIAPELIAGSFEGEDIPRALAEPCSNFTYYYILSLVGYCVFCNLKGKKPDQIPFISEWSELLVGPF
ncbi:Inherit from NOG: protein transport [Seminavis robusta]|uniref:Inherit from NOG: protein transport n=1 Tax=Seminavis robusta TaxID=568900 RepID=A0A9N8HR43_9STRA|nr:Inherit from NOG: protein transport [Seminavis robusta]|eukprot:Sro1043_g234750.1 Inherit from NOG: protein transport (232) ;mRNA; r:4512-5207